MVPLWIPCGCGKILILNIWVGLGWIYRMICSRKLKGWVLRRPPGISGIVLGWTALWSRSGQTGMKWPGISTAAGLCWNRVPGNFWTIVALRESNWGLPQAIPGKSWIWSWKRGVWRIIFPVLPRLVRPKRENRHRMYIFWPRSSYRWIRKTVLYLKILCSVFRRAKRPGWKYVRWMMPIPRTRKRKSAVWPITT